MHRLQFAIGFSTNLFVFSSFPNFFAISSGICVSQIQAPWPQAPICILWPRPSICIYRFRTSICVCLFFVSQLKFVIVNLISSACFRYFFKIVLGVRLCYSYSTCLYKLNVYLLFLNIMWKTSKFQLSEISSLRIFPIFLTP